jgi:hypothetical protein
LPKTTLKSRFFHFLKRFLPAIFFLLSLTNPCLVVADEVFLENTTTLTGDPDTLLNSPFRIKIDLSGMWDYAVEGGGKGKIGVPSAYDFVGNVSFVRNIDLTLDQLEDYTFHLVHYGVNYQCDSYINGDFLASHSGGYTSFSNEIPDAALQPGSENQIRLDVKNALDGKTTIPAGLQIWGWRNYGGILRDLYLLGTPKLFLRDFRVHSEPTGESTFIIRVEPDVEGIDTAGVARHSFGFFFELVEKISGQPVGKSKVVGVEPTDDGWHCGAAELSLKDLNVWTPDQPDLYVVRVSLVRLAGKEQTVVDQISRNHGFRETGISGGDFLLNGRKLVLRGVVWNEDHPTWGSSLPYEQMEKDVVLMKALGANAVRFANHPPHPYMLDLCDRYGLFALVELPVAYLPVSVLADEYYTQLAVAMMREMVRRDRSHASVLAWGIGEGFESSSVRARPFVESVAAAARNLDDRPLYYASVMNSSDVCTDLVDFAALSVFATDARDFKRRLEEWKEKHPSKPVVVAKFGKEVRHDNRNGYSDPLSQEAQARFFLHRLEDIRALAYDGAFVWALNDWRADRPSLAIASGDPWMHSMGLVNHRREKRISFEAVRSVFRGEKYVALPAGSFSSTAPIVYVLSGLILLIGTAYLYNADRRFRESINRSLMNSYNFFSDIRDQRAVSLLHSAMVGMVTSTALAVVTSTALYHARGSWVLDATLSSILSSDRVKESVIGVIRNPLELILYSAVLYFVLLLCISVTVYIAARVMKSRLFPYHAYSVTMWSTVPLVVLIPVGMILFRLLETGEYVLPSFGLVCLLLVWTGLRIHKGAAIVSDVFKPKVYVVGFVVLFVIALTGYFFLDYSQSASDYLRFLSTVAAHS